MTTTENPVEPKRGIGDWFLRLIKGTLAGIGGIVPGLSGGVLLVVFGIYEPLMQFLGHLRIKFWKNVRYFLPVGIGIGLGILGFSAVIDFAFTHYAAQFHLALHRLHRRHLPLAVQDRRETGSKSLALGPAGRNVRRYLLPDALDGDHPEHHPRTVLL